MGRGIGENEKNGAVRVLTITVIIIDNIIMKNVY